MKTKVCKVILMFVLVMGFGLCLLNGEEHLWKFNETSGTIARDSRGTVNGTLMGCATFLRCGEGIYLNGSNESYVSFGKSIGQFGTKEFTVYLEFKTADKNKYLSIVGNRTATNHGNYFDIGMMPDGAVHVSVDEDGSGKNYIFVKSQGGLNDGNWHNLAVTRVGKYLNLYIDVNTDGIAQYQGSANSTANINNGNEFRLGRSVNYPTAYTPNAVYSKLYVSDVSLTQNEIKAMFKK